VTLTEFLQARIAADEGAAKDVHSRDCSCLPPPPGFVGPFPCDCGYPARVLAECEAKRRIVELHRDWPVLVERPTEFEPSFGADLSSFTLRATRQIQWMTEQAYREGFGDEPPTGPILRALASVYADHPDYREEWRP